MSINYKFSGHETFHCRSIWLKKGYDYSISGKLFSENESVIDLGVGKNMVSSIKFWLRAFGFYNLNNNKLNSLSKDILDNDGYDPYLENDATLYLLHYLLIKNINVSSIYYLIFIKLPKEKDVFTSSYLQKFIKRECLKENVVYNENTVKNDINVFLKNYIPSDDKKGNKEDNYGGLFYDLKYITKYGTGDNGERQYRFNINEGKFLPEVIFLYVLLDIFKDETSINIEQIRDKVSSIFLIERQGTYSMIERLVKAYPKHITYKDDGGRQEVQIRKEMDKDVILREYYAKF